MLLQGGQFENGESDKKLKELILYICLKEEGDENFGLTKLNKILFKADFLAYRYWGKPMTGQDYFKLENGPAPRRMVPVTEMMKQCDELFIRLTPHYGYPQKRPIAKREPDLSLFTG